MNRRSYLSVLTLVIVLIVGLLALPSKSVLAVPPTPSSFYGTVTQGGEDVAIGVLVCPYVDGSGYTCTSVFESEGHSVYRIDVPGDDPDTTGTDEGGENGDTVLFRVDGVIASPSGTWQTGTNVELNLEIPPSSPLSLVSVSPDYGDLDSSVTVTLTGNNTSFADSVTSAYFGPDITIDNLAIVSTTQAIADISIAASAATGYRDVSMTSNSEIVTKTNAFYVRSTTVDVWLPSNFNGSPGAEISVPVTVPVDVTGLGIISYEFGVAFDSTVLESIGVTTTGSMSADWGVPEYHATPGQIQIAAYDTEPLAGNDVLINLLFSVVGSSGDSSNLALSDFSFNAGSPGSLTHDGSIIVGDLGIAGYVSYAGSSRPVQDVTMTLSGDADDTSVTNAAGAYQFGVATTGDYAVIPTKVGEVGGAISGYDAAHVARCVVGSLSMSNCPLASSDVDEDGKLMAYDAALIARWVIGLTDLPSRAGTWTFGPPQRSYSPLLSEIADQNFSAYLAGDVTSSWGDAPDAASVATPVDISIEQPRISRSAAQTTASIRTGETDNYEIFAYYLQLDLDPNILDFEKIVKSKTLSADWNVLANGSSPGQLQIVAYGTEALNGSGDLLDIHFNILDNEAAVARLELTKVILNEGTPTASIVGGNWSSFLPAVSQND